MKDNSYFLYAEDDEDDVILLQDMMELTGQKKEVVRVPDGYEVIKYLQNIGAGASYPSLIILDIHMPRLSGTETLELLKADDMYRMIPVLMLSVSHNDEIVNFCSHLGTEVVAKPGNFGHWYDAIQKICSYIDE
jgi:CheY-like chemotaxis protein